jgi:hypothetical protein
VCRALVERRVLAEDGRLELLQLGPGVETELFGEDLAALLEDAKCLGLTAGPVQGEHELPAQALPEGVFRDQRGELGRHAPVVAEGEVRVDAVLEGCKPQLLEPRRLPRRELLEGEIGERRSAPLVEGVLQAASRDGCVAGGEERPPLRGPVANRSMSRRPDATVTE